ncbi:penicillin acylase family protein [Methylobacterium sp. J-070]|uniref:penicillin acylase family protein n=1 Tax=Methylobacterium sp. J-070 TaxID=2836650 RepID=UPI001FB963A2|nr:penicillin acylase family protein [Methylobacterium sp. J-070]MCJ2053481.1 penicillin acylase family protein [Methylobacterium sp. J-070]
MSGATYPLPGLEAPAEIRVDRWGLAHIRAGTTLDAFRAQGFNAARDRLWQLDLWRKRGLGLLAADFGPGYLAQDRAARLFLYRGDMAAEWAAYGPQDTKAIVTAFVDGLNAFVALTEARPELLPPEFALTATRPGRWQPEDVVRIRSHALVRNVLSEVARARVLARAETRAAGLAADDLRKRISPPHDPVVPDGLDAADWPDDLLDEFRLATAAVGFTPERMAAAREDAWAWSKVDAHGAVTRDRRAAPREPAEGSNNWVIGPSRTDTGRPILASDPHRVYLQPSLRYAVHLTAPGLDVIGAGEPALPGISIGHNGRAAFSLTIAPMDQEDLFVCATDPDDPDRFRYGAGWEPITRIAETIPVRGGPDETVVLGFTRHGPVIREAGGRAFALRTVWSEPGSAAYLGSLAYLGATDPEGFGAALRHWSAPSVNQLYADAAGRIAWFMAGKAPVRPAHDGLLPVPGDGRYDWAGFHDPGTLPRSIDPDTGWLATANEMNLPPDFPVEARKVGFEWAEPWRARRIRAVLGAQIGHNLEDSRALQGDAVSEPALRLADLIRALPAGSDPDVASAQALLASFDGALHPESAAAALIELVWVHHLRPALLAALVPDAGTRRLLPPGDTQSLIERLESGLDPATRDRLLMDGLGAAFRECLDRLGPDPSGQPTADTPGTLPPPSAGEDGPRVSEGRVGTKSREGGTRLPDEAIAFTKAEPDSAPSLPSPDPLRGPPSPAEGGGSDAETSALDAGWSWGRLHHALFAHPLTGLRPDEAWDVGPLPVGGSAASVMHAEYRTDTFRLTHGASFRMVVDVGDWDRSVFVNVPGQSGNPESPHYADLAPVWGRQDHVPMLYGRATVDAATETVIALTPGPA